VEGKSSAVTSMVHRVSVGDQVHCNTGNSGILTGKVVRIIFPSTGHKTRVVVSYSSGVRKTISVHSFRRQQELRRLNCALLPRGKVCSWVDCYSRDSCRFHIIPRLGDDNIAGGQDWGSMEGATLCHRCYMRFWRNGSLVLPFRD
jgi:hypothetical protein